MNDGGCANEGTPSCTCIGTNGQAHNDDGSVTTTKANFSGHLYPGDYGESCKAHAEPGADDCQGDSPAAWCSSSWCYVDPCFCDMTDMGESDYFTSTKSGDKLFYSYEVCGSANAYTSEACTATTTEAACTDNSKCSWASDACSASLDQQATARIAATCDATLAGNLGPSQCRCLGSNGESRVDVH